MPLFYQHNINQNTRLAVWHITEAEAFFTQYVPLQSAVTHPHKRLQHLAGRYLLYFLFDDFPVGQIEIAGTRKPFLKDEQYHFSISHCGNYAAAIVSKDERVGIDIEIPTTKVLRVLKKFLSKNELVYFNLYNAAYNNNLATAEQINQSTFLWSAKEAIFKWWGSGEVDFSEMMHIEHFELQHEGACTGWFKKSNTNTKLPLTYKQFNNLCLVYTTTNKY